MSVSNGKWICARVTKHRNKCDVSRRVEMPRSALKPEIRTKTDKQAVSSYARTERNFAADMCCTARYRGSATRYDINFTAAAAVVAAEGVDATGSGRMGLNPAWSWSTRTPVSPYVQCPRCVARWESERLLGLLTSWNRWITQVGVLGGRFGGTYAQRAWKRYYAIVCLTVFDASPARIAIWKNGVVFHNIWTRASTRGLIVALGTN